VIEGFHLAAVFTRIFRLSQCLGVSAQFAVLAVTLPLNSGAGVFQQRCRAMNSSEPSVTMEILLVEDEMEDANITIQALRRGKMRCRVTLVCDGEEAIRFLCRKQEFARAPKPDLVLLDMLLPKKEGQHVLAEIRRNVELMDIPVIVLSGSLVHRVILEAEGLRVDGFMAKPVDLNKFIAAVKSLHRSWLTDMVLAAAD
jgi:CheY-like chemotaxis protein